MAAVRGGVRRPWLSFPREDFISRAPVFSLAGWPPFHRRRGVKRPRAHTRHFLVPYQLTKDTFTHNSGFTITRTPRQRCYLAQQTYF